MKEKEKQRKENFFKSDSGRMFLAKYGIGIILVIMMVFIAVAEPSFLTGRNMINVATQISINGSKSGNFAGE